LLDIFDYIIIFILGSLGGFVSGFLGVGGGIIYIPILDYFLQKMGMKDDVLVKGILANSLFTIIFSGSVASYKQYKMGNFFPKEILQTAIPGMFSALVLTYLIKSGTWYSRTTFLYVFAMMLLVIIVRMFLSRTKEVIEETAEAKNYQYRITGFFAGIITAFSGLGGGVVMTPIFTDVLKQHIKKSSSISNGVIPCFAIVIGIYNLSSKALVNVSEWQVGYIVLPLVLPMIIATFFFAPLGVKISQTTKPHVIRMVFASFVSIVFIKLIYEIFFI
jgi:uncharacterized membrane protein YfcA